MLLLLLSSYNVLWYFAASIPKKKKKKKTKSVAVAVVVANAKNPNPLHQEGRIKAKIPEIS